MKILLVNDTDKEFGGAEKYMFTLAELLREHGHQIEIFGSRKFNTNLSYISRIYNISDCSHLTNLLKAFQPDVVHIHKMNLALSPSILKVIKNFTIPVVMTVHDFHYVCPDDWLIDSKNQPCYRGFSIKCIFSNCYRSKLSWKYKCLRIYHIVTLLLHRRQLRKYVDQFIAPSNSLAQMMRANLNLDRIHVVHNIVKFRSDGSRIPISDSKKLLYIGRLSKEKGAEYIISAMPKILEQYAGAELTLVGTGPEQIALETLAIDLEIAEKVHFAGFVKEDRLPYYYQQSELVIVPSYWAENNPIVCLEAMAYGRPIIASNLFGLAEIVSDDAGVLFNPRDINDLTSKIIGLLSNFSAVQHISDTAQKKITAYNSKDEHYHAVLKIYNSIIRDCSKNY